MAEPAPPAGDEFVDVLYYRTWWDCPRSGVTVVDGVPMHFYSPFDEDLDDYAAEFYLWPATADEVSAGLAAWREFANWRALFDAGERRHPHFRKHRQPLPPATARRAVPEWKLDPNRSYADRTPKHSVRWRFVG